LIEPVAARDDLCGAVVAVEPGPAVARFRIAGPAGEAPDRAVIVHLVEIAARGRDRDRLRVVVEQPPAGASVGVARDAVEAPERPAVVELIELAPGRRDRDGR